MAAEDAGHTHESLLREAEQRWRATASNRRLAALILPTLVECLLKLSHYADAEELRAKRVDQGMAVMDQRGLGGDTALNS